MRIARRFGPLLRLGLVCLPVVGCVPAVASSVSVSRAGLQPASRVVLSATRDPVGGEEIGVVEAHGLLPRITMAQLAAEFRARVAAMGGDVGRIDRIATGYEERIETRIYECGHSETQMEAQSVSTVGPDGTGSVSTAMVPVAVYVSQTCTESYPVEDATLTLVGRAFRTAGGTP